MYTDNKIYVTSKCPTCKKEWTREEFQGAATNKVCDFCKLAEGGMIKIRAENGDNERRD